LASLSHELPKATGRATRFRRLDGGASRGGSTLALRKHASPRGREGGKSKAARGKNGKKRSTGDTHVERTAREGPKINRTLKG